MDPVPWREAWHDALYAAGRGFYVARGGPAAHFTTATHGPSGRVLAEALLRLAGHRPSVVVDVGAGRGELATHLLDALDAPDAPTFFQAPPSSAPNAALGVELTGIPRSSTPSAAFGGRGGVAPAEAEDVSGAEGASRTRVIAVDVVERPERLDERIEWVRSPGGASLPDELHDLEDALVIAHEWLDVVPCEIAEVDADGGLRHVLVDPETGAESLGPWLSLDHLAWAETHWPTSEPGDRVEIGRTRDLAWRNLTDRVRTGTVVAVDYGHTKAARPSGGTLTAYASGRQVDPVPNGSCDITAHVAMDSLEHDDLRTQRELLRELGILGRTPPIGRATTDPLGYLGALERAAAEAQLIDPDGFGAFWWAVRRLPAGHGPGMPQRSTPDGAVT